MLKASKIDKIIGILFIFASIFFIISEYYTLSYAFYPTGDLYIKYSISRLAVPIGNIYFNSISTLSPKANVLNNGIIFLGISILIGNIITIRKEIPKYKFVLYILSIILFIGTLIVAIFHTGIPNSNTHRIGAYMAFFGGSFLLLFIGLSIKDSPLYKYTTLILGIISLASLLFFFVITKDSNYWNYRGLIERIHVYSLQIWMIITGIRLILSPTIEEDNTHEIKKENLM